MRKSNYFNQNLKHSKQLMHVKIIGAKNDKFSTHGESDFYI